MVQIYLFNQSLIHFRRDGELSNDSLRTFLYVSKPMILEEYKISSPNVLHIAQRTSFKKKKEIQPHRETNHQIFRDFLFLTDKRCRRCMTSASINILKTPSRSFALLVKQRFNYTFPNSCEKFFVIIQSLPFYCCGTLKINKNRVLSCI